MLYRIAYTIDPEQVTSEPGIPYPTAVIITDFTIHNIGFEEKK